MNNQRNFVLISLLLTGIALFAALPAHAADVPEFKWEGVDSDSGRWQFSWKTPNGEYWAQLQFETNPDTWATLSNLQWSRSGQRTNVSSPALHNNPSGKTFKFRALVKACTEPSEENDWCDDPGFDAVDTYGWTELEVKFDD